MSANKTWFITGASKGFGLEFIKQLLAKGDNVAATSRSITDLEKAAGTHNNLLSLEVNLTDEQSVAKAIEATVAKFGRLDVVVNNAGYGLIGAIEELSDAEARQNFEVNVFGSLNVIRHALPHLREQKSGHIFNISSIGGFTGNFPGFGIYCSTKFAVAGFSESLAAETKDLGIKVTVVLPGYFRTSFLDAGSIATPKNPIDAYQSTRDSQKAHEEQINGNQAGDPVKGVAEIIKAADAPDAPLYFFLGSDAVALANQKIAFLNNEIDTWKASSTSTDF
ncbi:SDR family NAD(P)-dependent oxidoreductase [Flavobacterium zepuense]|uniref:SDR family NAD(P)-dependent oxidoreductase n=1 Tax=Flavobacterium zepuense TaxID=2593302 RepID=A0A552V2N3_9FLAO|nr:SDR family NAD(P)-dependent oxidoreductase [Flavobacterium zepuense]TRW24708.1 SDR family NAD(P)-dependent oxidoreductase [Flavobacterium zepuense]